MKKGFDANTDLSKFAKCLFEEEYYFVGRYYNINNPSKNLSFAEANYLSAIGLKIVALWENGFPTTSSYFSYSKGIFDGTNAYHYAETTINQPELTPIYFVVDYDASEITATGLISEYFQGIVDAFNQISNSRPKYLIGVYGSGLICRIIKPHFAAFSWLAQSVGWQESKTYIDYNIRQFLDKAECIDIGTIAGDPDESPNDNEGSFQIGNLTKILQKKDLFNGKA